MFCKLPKHVLTTFEPYNKFHENIFESKYAWNCAFCSFLLLWASKTSKKRDFKPTFGIFFKKLVGDMPNPFWGSNLHPYSQLFTRAFGEIILLSLQIRPDVLTKLEKSENSLKVGLKWAKIDSKSSSKVKIFNFFKMIPEHPRKVSKHSVMFYKLPKYVFDDFWVI